MPLAAQGTESGPALRVRRAFVLALLLGAGAIGLSQTLGNQLLSLLLPLLVMAGYIALGLYHGAADSIIEQFADSIYYMGFLFTLVALVASLHAFNQEHLEISVIVGNFSVALVTTIAGLAVRIVINNFRGDTQSTRRQLRDELDRSAEALVRNARSISLRLETLTTEMSAAVRRAMESAEHGMDGTVKALERTSRMASRALMQSTREANQDLLQAIDGLQQKLWQIQLPEDLFVRRMAAPVEQFVTRLGYAESMLERITTQQAAMGQGYDEAVAGLARVNGHIESLEDSLQRLDGAIDTDIGARRDLAGLAGEMAELLRGGQELSQQMTRQVQDSAAASTQLRELLSGLREFGGQLHTITEGVEEAGRALNAAVVLFAESAEAGAKIGSDAAAIARAFAEAREGLAPVAELGDRAAGMVDAFSRATDALREHSKLLEALEHQARGQVETLGGHTDELQRLLGEHRQVLEAVTRHFADAADYVTEQLGRDDGPGAC